jgi:hypothetical protein
MKLSKRSNTGIYFGQTWGATFLGGLMLTHSHGLVSGSHELVLQPSTRQGHY